MDKRFQVTSTRVRPGSFDYTETQTCVALNIVHYIETSLWEALSAQQRMISNSSGRPRDRCQRALGSRFINHADNMFDTARILEVNLVQNMVCHEGIKNFNASLCSLAWRENATKQVERFRRLFFTVSEFVGMCQWI